MHKPLRTGIIGLGVGERHIAGFEAHSDCRVTALCDFDPAKQAMAAERYPAMRLYHRAEDLLDDPDIDVVSIASYDDAHFDQILRAIAAGKHIFVEKPMCLTQDELVRIRAALNSRPDLRISSNLILRRAPRFMDLRRRIQDGGFGRLYFLEGDYNYGRLHKITDSWRGDIPYYSVVLGGAIHVMDLMLWLSGERAVEVSALSNRFCSEGTKFRHDDFCVALVRFESGATAKVSANYGCVYPHFHRLSIYGTEATFENRLDGGRLWTSRDPGQQPEMLDSPYPGVEKGALIYSFIEEIIGCGVADVSTDDVFKTMSVCLAINRAVSEGRPVTVDYI